MIDAGEAQQRVKANIAPRKFFFIRFLLFQPYYYISVIVSVVAFGILVVYNHGIIVDQFLLL
jgi:hypothetical protein